MFEQFMDLVKQHSGNAIVNNPDVPNEQNEAVTAAAGSSIMDSLKGMLSGDGAQKVLSLFHGSNTDVSDHPATQAVSSNLVTDLMNKFGFDSGKAGNIANSIVPSVMNTFVKKTNDPSDKSFDVQGVFNNLSGGKTDGMDISGMVSKFGGSKLDLNHDGKVNLSDLSAAFSGGAGGVIDKIKGLFGG